MNARAEGLIVALGVLVGSSGCIMWRSGDDLPYLEYLDFAPEGAWLPSLTYEWDYEQSPKPGALVGVLAAPIPNHCAGGSETFKAVVEASAWFTSVAESATPGDIHLDIKVKLNEWDQYHSTLGLLPIATFFALPYYVTSTTTVRVKARRRDGMQASYKIETGQSGIIWWAVLPLTPLMWEFPLPPPHGKWIQSLMRHLLLKLRRDGFLDKPK